jgi:hypothetical protein
MASYGIENFYLAVAKDPRLYIVSRKGVVPALQEFIGVHYGERVQMKKVLSFSLGGGVVSGVYHAERTP